MGRRFGCGIMELLRYLNAVRAMQGPQVGDDSDRVGVVHVVDVHWRENGRPIRTDAFFEHIFGLLVGVTGKARETRRPFSPVVRGMDRLDPGPRALEPARAIQIAVGVAGRVTLATHGDLFDEVAC